MVITKKYNKMQIYNDFFCAKKLYAKLHFDLVFFVKKLA